MKPIVLYPKIAEESATALAEALGCPLENPYETKKRGFYKKDYDFVINYGCSVKTGGVKKLNKAAAVTLSKDKIATFAALKGRVPCVANTTDYHVAVSWIKDGRTVVVRKNINGNNSTGIVFCNTVQHLAKYKDAPLYTRYIVKKRELRINVFQGKIVSVYNKVVPNEIFRFKLLKEYDKKLEYIAQKTYECIGLDWFGIDVIETPKGAYYILEVNSAPILFPTTTKKLVKHIKDWYEINK